ncbi:hypothetical protein [Aestuariivirga sp.]|uniref:hypothetical protein n=1 Tax=Aestuariivirga sp. TaxID=2650926 RepID=UPI003BA9247D
MANETEQLVVTLEARIRDFERNMAKASGTAGKEFGAIERRALQSARKMEGVFGNLGGAIKGSLGSIGPGFLAGGIAGLISAEGLQAIGNAVKSVADLADQAARVNVPVEDFQTLSFAAHQAGVETDKLENILQIFNREIGEAAIKGGDLKKILDANGVSLTDSNGKLRSTKELFYELVTLVSRAKTAQEAMVIATAAFGRGAGDALPFLRQGAQALREGEQAARDSGAVIDEQLVQAAADFDDKWTAAWDVWKAKGKGAILEVMTGLENAFGRLDQFLQKWNVTREALRANGNGLPGLSDGELDALGTIIPALSREGSKLTEINVLEQQRNDLQAKRLELETQIHQATSDGRPPVELEEYGERLRTILKQLGDVETRLKGLRPSNTTGPSWENTGRNSGAAPITVIPDLGSGGSSAGRASRTKVIHSEADALKRLTDAQQAENESLQVEARSMGLSVFEAARMRKEAELLASASRNGINITDEVRASISALAVEYGRGQQAMEASRLAQERSARTAEELVAAQQRAEQSAAQFGQAFSGAAKGFLSDLSHGVSATEALSSALSNLADQVLSLALNNLFGGLGGSGKMGMIGPLLGFAEGGIVRTPGARRYARGGHISGPGSGTSDSIPAMVSNGEFIVTAAATSKHRALLEAINSGRLPAFASGGHVGAPALAHAPGGGGMNVTTNVTVNGSGNGDPKADNLLAKKVAKEVEGSIRGIVFKEMRSQMRPGNVLSR